MFANSTFLAGQKPLILAIAASALGMMAATPADARIGTGIAALVALSPDQEMCMPVPAAAPVAAAGQASKSAAILGGQMSALDRIRMQQAGTPVEEAQPQQELAQMEPAAFRSSNANCYSQSIIKPAVFQPETDFGAGDNFLASSRIAIGQTPFNEEWERVSQPALTQNYVSLLIGETVEPDFATLMEVNSWVNNSIAHVEDRVLWRDSDYWATAYETLTRGRGDCEDFAILKYQMLIALGVRPEDMYLTLARDLARNSDHAMLIVKLNGNHYLLDNSTNAVLPATQSYDYRPSLSFNSESAWLHGFVDHQAGRQFAHLSVSATSIPRDIGFSK